MWRQFKSGNDRCMINVRTGHIIVFRNGREADRVDTHINARLNYGLAADARRVIGGK